MKLKLRKIAIVTALVCACALAGVPASAEDYLDYYEQGEFALRIQKWDRAIEYFTKALADNPKYFVAYHHRAIAYSKKGEYDKSIEDLRKAILLNPDYPDAYGLLALVCEIKMDYGAAFSAYREALAREKRPSVRKVLEKYIQDLEPKLKKK
jgi:tetratricopeptide (TPR) repeat protein